ncbi:uncharacterized protein LOC122502339 isoform X1 [Leptopilina heterotoma]|uniref:uncharacterized protein LOC122502339 isoform X1 n=1 Tax=Leptopilina heterotoma TaxID=63436 RepID=UPI001CA9CEA5|nr:uncharacterized protein LOC122502339 isoform X1 [Leptopilina heterotoma]XP_043468285.1 uncharacterized protein LOC122502339 isoform X1 [Leptopilina heterotoma]
MGLYTSMERKEFNKVMRILCDRMIKANCSSKTDIIQITSLDIDKFPSLKGSFGGDNFIWEFEQLVQVRVKDMRLNLTISIDKMLTILKVKTTEGDINRKALHLLKYLPDLFPSNGKKKQQNHSLLEMELREEAPSKITAPILIAADADGNQLKSYVDSEPMHCAQPFEAIILLMASYYIFNINYEKHLNLQFILLEYLIFGSEVSRISPGNSKYLSVTNVLEKAGITPKFYEMPKC